MPIEVASRVVLAEGVKPGTCLRTRQDIGLVVAVRNLPAGLQDKDCVSVHVRSVHGEQKWFVAADLQVGLGRIVALYTRSSTSHQIH
jgi:hypothetical protein